MSSPARAGAYGSPALNDSHSVRGLAAFARRWGYGCEVAAPTGASTPPLGDEPLARGLLSTTDLPGGMRLCLTDLTATRDNARAGLVRGCVTIVMVLDGDPTSYTFGRADALTLRAGSAAIAATGSEERLAAHYHRGHRARGVVLQLCPSAIRDEALAAQVETVLARTSIVPFALSDRLRMLTAELFMARPADPIGRLLAESCALELLARGLAADGTGPRPPEGLSPQDVAKIMRVHERLLAEPEGDHRLEDLARVAGMGVTTLKTKFPQVVGQSVFDFLRELRLERARRGLEAEGWSVKQAAFFAGYRHSTNFATAYRRRFGAAPHASRPR